MKKQLFIFLALLFGLAVGSLFAEDTKPADVIDPNINDQQELLNMRKMDLRPKDVIPSSDDHYNLGVSTYRWKNIVASSATINNLTVGTLSGVSSFTTLTITTLTVTNIVPSTNSVVTAYTGNGFGSTNNHIRRFTSSASTGTAITYTDSGTNGATFTINLPGFYFMIDCDQLSSDISVAGISLNSTELTTTIADINIASRMALQMTRLNVAACASAVHYLVAGDVLRPHTSGSEDATTRAWMRVEKLN